MKKLSENDLAANVRGQVYVQDYSKKKTIDGVRIAEVKRWLGEDGTFEELSRIDENGALELFPDFKVRQISRSKIMPGGVKAWHIHYEQEDVWYVPPEDHMVLGLWDIRSDSDTKDVKMRIVLGSGSPRLVYIPRGVAHGVMNVGLKPGTVVYFVNKQYDINEPDERRLKWDAAGADFWTIEKG